MSVLVVPCADKRLVLPLAWERSCCTINCQCWNSGEKAWQEPHKNIQFTVFIDRPDSVWMFEP